MAIYIFICNVVTNAKIKFILIYIKYLKFMKSREILNISYSLINNIGDISDTHTHRYLIKAAKN